jgi:hypothetical protein
MILEKNIVYESTGISKLRINDINIIDEGIGYQFIIENYEDDDNVLIYKILNIKDYPEFPMLEKKHLKKYFDLKQIRRDYTIEKILQ